VTLRSIEDGVMFELLSALACYLAGDDGGIPALAYLYRVNVVLESSVDASIRARIAAAAAHLRASLGGTIPSYFRDPAEPLAAARKELGDATYRQLWSDGEALDPDEALAYALEVLPSPD